jgi:hypothetical protein
MDRIVDSKPLVNLFIKLERAIESKFQKPLMDYDPQLEYEFFEVYNRGDPQEIEALIEKLKNYKY